MVQNLEIILARFGQKKMGLGYLDDKYVKVVDALNVIAGAHFGDQLGIQEPWEIHVMEHQF